MSPGHCRRRKIRCIPALDDTSGRCSNCIRLKKDCQFYPVDQNTIVGRRGRSGSKAETSIGEEDISASSSDPGGPHILRSSTEDSLSHMSDQSRTPVSPEEHFKYPRMSRSFFNTSCHTNFADYPQSHKHETFGHQIDPPSLKSSELSSSSDVYSDGHFFVTSEAQRLHGTHPSAYGRQTFHSPSAGAHEQGFFPPQHHIDGNDLEWATSGVERTVSTGAGAEPYPTFATHRANSFPAFPSRSISASHDISSNYTGPPGYAGSADYQQQLLAQQYVGTPQYANMDWAAHPNARSLPSGTTAGFTQPWFNTPLSYVREEEDAGYTQGHTRRPFQPG